MAFPRLNAALVLALRASAASCSCSASSPTAARRGRAGRAYAPLSIAGARATGRTYWILSLHILTASVARGRDQLHRHDPQHAHARDELDAHAALRLVDRASTPGCSWSILPVLSAGLTLLLLDRGISIGAGTCRRTSSTRRGRARRVLYQHAFWFFGHPEVYVMVAAGVRDHLGGPPGLRAQADLRLQGDRVLDGRDRRSSRCSCGRTTCSRSGSPSSLHGVLHDRVDGHRRPDGGEDLQLARDRSGAATCIFDTPMLFALGFLSIFTIGGLTGIYLAAFPIDWQVHDTLLRRRALPLRAASAASIFAIFAGLFYWWPKMFGRLLDERLGKWQFWLLFVGFNVTFFPQHLLGLEGMPRRVYTYSNGELGGLQPRPRRSARASWAIGVLLFVVNVVADAAQRAARRRTTRGRPTRSSGTRPRRRPPHNFDERAVRHERDGRSTTCGGGCVSSDAMRERLA